MGLVFQTMRSSKKFFEDIFKKTNIFFTVLTNEEEIRLIYNAVSGSVETTKGVIFYINPKNSIGLFFEHQG